MNKKAGKEQFVVPYLMSSHPGSTMKEAVKLAEYIRDLGYMPEQVQDFYPTPATISTCMYYTGLDPRTMEKVYVPKSAHEKEMQRALIQYRNPANYDLVVEALRIAGRTDLIGFSKECLVKPRKNIGGQADRQQTAKSNGKSGRNSLEKASVKTNRNTNSKSGSLKGTGNTVKNVKELEKDIEVKVYRAETGELVDEKQFSV